MHEAAADRLFLTVLFSSKQAKQPSLLRAGSIIYVLPMECTHLWHMCMHDSAWRRGKKSTFPKQKLVSAELECLAWAAQVPKAVGAAGSRTALDIVHEVEGLHA